MHDTEKFESLQNIIPNRHNKSNIAIFQYHQNNYYRQNNTPKIAKQASQVSQYNRASLEIEITQFHHTKLLIWIYG
jgi:hypothetical protein